MKFCKKCNTETERYASGNCKPCGRVSATAWNGANLEKTKAIKAAWKKANPEKVRAEKAAWFARNTEWTKAYQSARYAANPERAKAYNAARYAANPEKHKASVVAWQAANPGKVRINTQNRRALKKQAGGKLSKGLSAKLFKLQKGKCPCCNQPLGDNYHLDHIVPLVLGGSNTDDNIQLLRQRCNNQKHAKDPIDFMQSRGFLI